MLSLLFHSSFYSAPFIVTLTLVTILGLAALYDLKTFTIPHIFSYAIIALFIGTSLVTGLTVGGWGWHIVSALIALLIAFGLFFMGLMGGGDVKIFTALALWVHPMGLFGLLPAIAVTGAIIGIAALIYKMVSSPTQSENDTSLSERLRLAKNQRIPYGPAIAIGATLYLLISGNL